jgi:hypothetical protein
MNVKTVPVKFIDCPYLAASESMYGIAADEHVFAMRVESDEMGCGQPEAIYMVRVNKTDAQFFRDFAARLDALSC